MTIERTIKSIPVIIVVILACLFFIPRSYDVQSFKKRPGTEYWNLSTGSKIGYTKIKSVTEKTKTPIIYLHGGPGGMIKDKTIEELRPFSTLGHDIYLYDQIGSGHSDRLEDLREYTVTRHKKDLKEIIEKINSKKVILLAHSWGCLLAINYIEDYPEKIERMILEGPGPILPINTKLKDEIPPDSLNLISPEYSNAEGNKKANNLRSKLMLHWAYKFNSKLASDREADDFFTYLNEELNKSTTCKAQETMKTEGGGGYYAHIMTVKSFYTVVNKRDRLIDIDIPTLILRGQCDNQRWGYAKEYLDILSHSQLAIIENAGHDLVQGNEEMYYKLTTKFLTHLNN